MTTIIRPALTIASLLVALLLSACAPAAPTTTTTEAAPGNTPPEVAAIEAYLNARVAADENALRQQVCAAYEQNAAVEASSFAGLNPTLVGPDCVRDGSEGDAALVTCRGSIDVTYGADLTSFPLGRFRVVQEGGQWRMCGAAS